MIVSYICYYNTRRAQRNLDVLTPMEKYLLLLAGKTLYFFTARLTGCGSTYGLSYA